MTQVRTELEAKVAELGTSLSTTEEERRKLLAELGSTRDRASALEARLADADDRTVLAQRELAARDLRIEELLRSSKDLEAKLGGTAGARDDAVQQVQVLTAQIATLSQQLTALDEALDLKQSEIDAQSDTIANLGQRLNVALASKVEELSQYRSEFFGELRKALGDRADVRIVGDRFVFQSEVLFGSGSDVIAPGGRDELAKLADALKEIIGRIPAGLPWVLQVDGHTDRVPISTPRFPSNWELSTARAIAVAQFLVAQGIPPDRVAARGFAEFQPLDPGDGPEALQPQPPDRDQAHHALRRAAPRSVAQALAEADDPPAGLLEQVGAGGVGDAEIGVEAEGGAVDDGHALVGEQRGGEVGAGLEQHALPACAGRLPRHSWDRRRRRPPAGGSAGRARG